MQQKHPKTLLIGGTSHSGKSTLAAAVAERRDWEMRSTDRLARHPGRPWSVGDRPVPDHVISHYSTMQVEELLEDVLRHYRQNVIPQVVEMIKAQAEDPHRGGLVLEGSALWPQFVVDTGLHESAQTLWLCPPEKVVEERILTNSGFANRTTAEQRLIRKFIDRSLAYHRRMEQDLERLKLPAVRDGHGLGKALDRL